jgi:hypothetical protein
MDRKEVGLEYFRIIWLRIASDVVEKAIRVYELDSKQAEALRKAFLKPNHYYALIR